MTIEMLREFLGWATLINLGLLYLWFFFFVFAHGWMYRLHSQWFKIPMERFDSIHYAGMAFYKIGLFIFNLVPYLVLLIIS
ncbi:MAG: hypothetical protein PHF31_00925 [Methylobacter sp.]|nr:hypothetical protein [Methylobacter sp.]